MHPETRGGRATRADQRGRLRRTALAAASALPALASPVLAATPATWLAPVSGTWGVPGNWSTNPHFPNNGTPAGTTYDVTIGTAGAPYTVVINPGAGGAAGITVDRLTLDSADATVQLGAGAGTAFRVIDVLRLNAGTFVVDGGTLRNTVVERAGSAQLFGVRGELDGVTLRADMTVPNNAPFSASAPPLVFRNGLTLDSATLRLVETVQPEGNTWVAFHGTQWIGGTGTIELRGRLPGLELGSGTVTIGSGITVRGRGAVGPTNGTVINEGAIVADDPGEPIQIIAGSNGTASLVNRGVIEAAPGALVILQTPFDNSQGVFRADGGRVSIGYSVYPTARLGTLESINGGSFGIAGRIDNAATTFTATDATGDLYLYATVTSGTLATSGSASHRAGAATLESLSVTGRVLAQAGPPGSGTHRLYVHDVTLAGGSIVLGGAHGGGYLSSTVNSTLGGTGTVLFDGATNDNRLLAEPGATLTFGPGVTVRATNGGGTIGFETGNVVNRGAIVADATVSRPLSLHRMVNEGSITVTGLTRLIATNVDNRGRLRVGGSSATFNGTWTNAGGVIEATGGASIELWSTPADAGSWSVTDSTLRVGSLFNLPPPTANATFTTAQLQQMSLNNATLAVGSGGRIENAGQTLNLDSGNTLLLAGGTLSGGTLTRSGTERAAVAAGRDATIDNVTVSLPLTVERGGRLFSTGDLTLNDGQIVLESTQPGGFGAALYVLGAGGAIDGTGQVRFAGAGAGTHSSVDLPPGGLTIGPNVTVRTDGGNGAFIDPVGNPNGALVNLGSINSQLPGNHVRVGGTFTNHGTVRVTNGGSFAAERGFTNHGTFVVGADTAARVTFDGLHNQGTVALDGTLIVRRATGSTITELVPQLVSGYAGGAWDGPGINSPAAAATAGYGVGIADSNDLFETLPATFQGQSVDGPSTLLHFTLLGDADMNGTVGLSDFNRLAAHFGYTGVYWARGDFNYDGRVNLQDFNLLAANFGLTASGPTVTPEDWASLASAVPEPSLGFAFVGAAALLARVRRRNCIT